MHERKTYRAISSVWLECLLDMQEVTGSSPVSPNLPLLLNRLQTVRRLSIREEESTNRCGRIPAAQRQGSV